MRTLPGLLGLTCMAAGVAWCFTRALPDLPIAFYVLLGVLNAFLFRALVDWLKRISRRLSGQREEPKTKTPRTTGPGQQLIE